MKVQWKVRVSFIRKDYDVKMYDKLFDNVIQAKEAFEDEKKNMITLEKLGIVKMPVVRLTIEHDLMEWRDTV